MSLAKVLEKLKGRLFKNPELAARQIYEFCLEQPREVIEYLQAYINDVPLTKQREKYVQADDYD